MVMLSALVDSTLVEMCTQCSNVVNDSAHWFDATVSIGDLLSLFGTLLGLGLAIHQYKKSSKASRDQDQQNQKETWFLNVIVLPQLEPINSFYHNLFKSLEEDKSYVSSLASEAHKDYVINLAKLKARRKKGINDFFDQIIALVESYDVALSSKVGQHVMNLEDIYVKIIDSYSDKSEINEREKVLNNKKELIVTLNSGMKKSNPS